MLAVIEIDENDGAKDFNSTKNAAKTDVGKRERKLTTKVICCWLKICKTQSQFSQASRIKQQISILTFLQIKLIITVS